MKQFEVNQGIYFFRGYRVRDWEFDENRRFKVAIDIGGGIYKIKFFRLNAWQLEAKYGECVLSALDNTDGFVMIM